MASRDSHKENDKPPTVNMSASPEPDQTAGRKPAESSADELRLERYGNNLENVDVDEDMDEDDDDEQDHIAHHPLLGMLAGRLGQPRRRGSTHRYDSLHPVTSVLTAAHVDDCYELEQSFPEQERATREKVGQYQRLIALNLSLLTRDSLNIACRDVQN
jgi:hypothetical protein